MGIKMQVSDHISYTKCICAVGELLSFKEIRDYLQSLRWAQAVLQVRTAGYKTVSHLGMKGGF